VKIKAEPRVAVRRDPFHQAPLIRIRSWRAFWASVRPTLSFLMETEVHVYAFAVAANVLISFFPFLVVMILICRSFLHWEGAVQAIFYAVNDYFPATFNLTPMWKLLDSAARSQHAVSWLSVLLLLFTANGIFEPLEVALNRIWRVTKNRSFLRNQLISLGLIFVCGALTLASTAAAAVNLEFISSSRGVGRFAGILDLVLFKVVAVPLLTSMIFLVYWVLPNRKIPVRRLIPAAVTVGLMLEVLKYVFVLTWPWLRAKLEREVPPFVQSISIILWGFCSAMLILAGAEWSARVQIESIQSATIDIAPDSEPDEGVE
jgi:membrane protein